MISEVRICTQNKAEHYHTLKKHAIIKAIIKQTNRQRQRRGHGQFKREKSKTLIEVRRLVAGGRGSHAKQNVWFFY